MEFQIAFPLVQGSHVFPRAELVENVLVFAEEWEKRHNVRESDRLAERAEAIVEV